MVNRVTDTLRAATRRAVFCAGVVHDYDAGTDGERFMRVEDVAGDKPLSIHVVQNWYEEFREREQD